MNIDFLRVALLLGAVALFGAGCGNASKTVVVPPGGVYVSKDGGQNWTQMSKYKGGLDITKVTPFKIVFDPYDTAKLYMASGPSGLLHFDNITAEWDQVKTPVQSVNGVAVHPRNPNILFVFGNAATDPQRYKIWKSFDDGKTWAEIYVDPVVKTGGILNTKVAPGIITAMEVDPTRPEILLAGSNSGALLMTGDGGATWSNAHSFAYGIAGVRVAPATGQWFVLLVNGQIFTSGDGGKTFSLLEIKNGDTVAKSLLAIQFVSDGNKTKNILAGTDRGIFNSGDNGKNWSVVPLPVSEKQSVSINAIAAGAGKTVYAGANYVLYTSRDGGKKWRVYQFPLTNTIRFLLTDPKDANTVYAVFNPAS